MAQFAGSSNTPAAPGAAQPTTPVLHQVSEPKCKVCKYPHRREIDMMLATGWSQADVRKHWNQVEGFEMFSHANISVHSRKHMTTKDAAVRRIMEQRARQEGLDVDAVEGFITTKRAVLDLVIASGIQGLHAGITMTEPREIIAAVAMLDKMEAEWKETAIDEMLKEFRAFSDAVKAVVSEEMYAAIFAKYEATIGTETNSLRQGLPLVAGELDEAELAEFTEVDE